MHSAIHTCKQTEHDVKFSNAEEAVAEEYAQVRSLERKKAKGNQGESIPTASESLVAEKLAYKTSKQALGAAKLAGMMDGVEAFEL